MPVREAKHSQVGAGRRSPTSGRRPHPLYQRGGGVSPLRVCGLSLPVFLVLLFTGVVLFMYAYFFYAILAKGGSGAGAAEPRTFREEHLVMASKLSAAEEAGATGTFGGNGDGAAAPAAAGRTALETVPDVDMFRPLGDAATIHVDGGEDRIWYTGKEVFLEIGCTEAQFATMRFAVHGPVQIVPARDIRSRPMADAFCGRVVSYVPPVPGQYTFVITTEPTGALAGERFQRAFFHKVVDAATFPRTHVAAVESLRRRIRELQNPPDCSTARLYLYNLNHGMDYGVGVNTEYMVAAFGRALAANRTFVLPTKPNKARGFGFYWADGTCDSDSWMCFFFPVSKCTEADMDLSTIVKDADVSQRPDWSTQDQDAARVVMGEACPKPMGPAAFAELAEAFAPYGKPSARLRGQAKCHDGEVYGGEANCLSGAAWVAAHLTEYVFRPLPWLVSIFDEAKYSHHVWEFPLTTVHIRKTDKLQGNLKEAKDPLHVYDLHNYFSAVDELAAWQAPKQVRAFIATDSDKVIAEIKADYTAGRSLMFDDQQVRYEKGTILQLREHPGSVNQKEESVNALKDIWLLSQGSAFIGTRSSFFGRTGFLLMYASGRMESYRLLDSDPWGTFPVGRTLCF